MNKFNSKDHKSLIYLDAIVFVALYVSLGHYL